ncbi:MAG: putative porin [Candidatus Acidiferrales bacterium]
MPSQLRLKSKRLAIALALSLSVGGVATIALAGDTASSGGTGAGPTSSGSTAGAAKGSAAAPDLNSPIALELQELREAVQAQAQQFAAHSQEVDAERTALHDELARITSLEEKLGIAPDAAPTLESSTAAAVVSTPSLTQGQQAQTPQDLSNRIGNLEDRLKNFGPFSLSGDFRLRDEPFFGGPANQSLDQNRERFRLRFNVNAKLNDDFAGGFSLASGDINDPTSTNQTVTGFYTRKAIAIDKAFVDYSPHEFHSLTLIGGKFGYPWYNTELTWDKDLNSEGAAETLVFNLNSTPVLKKIAFVGFELPFSQVAGVSLTNQSLVASAVYGGQIQTTWQLASWLKFGAFSGFYNYHNADPIALALAKASSKNPQTPLTGLLPLGTGNTVQNSIVTTTSTNEVTIGGTSYPTGVTTVTNAQFASKFGLFDSLARFDVTTPSDKWPIAVIGDYVQNTEACANVDHILAAPANTASLHYTQSTNFPCDPNQRRGYWGEVQVGRAQKRGDWQFDYTRMFIEREAVLSNFDYSDIRQGSNVTEHRAMVIYEVHPNVQLSFTGLFGRPLNFGSTKPPEDFLKRLQFDLIYTF